LKSKSFDLNQNCASSAEIESFGQISITKSKIFWQRSDKRKQSLPHTERKAMKILLYNPDNGITRNFMPHLWMFLLQALTPKQHEVILIDGNAKAMTREELVDYCKTENIGLVGIGAMTRMIARAYDVADALREAGIKVVMGGPHVTECPDEALGRDGGKRHADAIALGEADETWALMVEDAAKGQLKEIYQPVSAHTLGNFGFRPIQSCSFVFETAFGKNGRRLGKFSRRADRNRTRLSIRLRVLHGYRIFRRFDSLPQQRERH